jgi:hypothetical protein
MRLRIRPGRGPGWRYNFVLRTKTQFFATGVAFRPIGRCQRDPHSGNRASPDSVQHRSRSRLRKRWPAAVQAFA